VKRDKFYHLVRRERLNKERGSELEIMQSVKAAMTPAHWDEIFAAMFALTWRQQRHEINEASSRVVKETGRARAAVRKSAKVSAIKLSFALMDHLLSTGKLLRYATFGEVRREGGWLSAIGKLDFPDNAVVGKHLTEANLKAMHKRAALSSVKKAA